MAKQEQARAVEREVSVPGPQAETGLVVAIRARVRGVVNRSLGVHLESVGDLLQVVWSPFWEEELRRGRIERVDAKGPADPAQAERDRQRALAEAP